MRSYPKAFGVVYIHSEEDQFESRTSDKTIEMLVKIIGVQFLDRVTVLIRSRSGPHDYPNFMPTTDSPLYPLYCNEIKPWTMPYPQDHQSVEYILGPYTQLQQRIFRPVALDNFTKNDGSKWKYDFISRHLWEFFPDDIGPLAIGRQQEVPEGERLNHETQRNSLCNTIRDHEEEILRLKSAKNVELKNLETSKNEEINKLTAGKNLEIKELEDKLQAKNDELVGLRRENERKIQDLTQALRAKEDEVMEHKAGGATKPGYKQAGEIYSLKADIRRINAEYSSLRTHMQVQEKTEEADITTALGDLNRMIGEFGQSLSERVEDYMQVRSPEKDLLAQDIMKLFQVRGETALKAREDTYLLLEYAIRATVCEQLYIHLFKPFHPNISGDESRNTFITQVYEYMVYQAPQSIAGRWRRDTFNSISGSPSLGTQNKLGNGSTHQLVTEALFILLGKIAGVDPPEILKEHIRDLNKAIAKGDELNRLLKGGVSFLGNFQPTWFSAGDSFQSDYMTEVKSGSKLNSPNNTEAILATIELGLTNDYALGDGQKPLRTILRQAVVFRLPM
ncbi:hypothetical protein RHS01_05538 [Rhizoctonia solani]|uniref:Uncharacterized protein n=1 Tax=Rhizoctonia solani TaxID=456999 RepID=A0A8H7ICA1_9AGAM|nr:hypothetical protein RHS01_05538 [Rhizoctonia solani]